MSTEDALDGFTAPRAYDRENLREAPEEPGVHIVYGPNDGEMLYVGHTSKLRSRMRQHLSGDREASVLYEQVGELLPCHRLSESDATLADSTYTLSATCKWLSSARLHQGPSLAALDAA